MGNHRGLLEVSLYKTGRAPTLTVITQIYVWLMDYQTIEHVPSQLVLSERKRAPYAQIPNMLAETLEHLRKEGVSPIGAPRMIYRDLPLAGDDHTQEHDIEVAWPIPQSVRDTSAMTCYRMPGGQMVTSVYEGPYDQIGPTYDRLLTWIRTQGSRVAGPVREEYLNDPRKVGMRHALTKIEIPI